VERRETHVSHVFLAGPFAYKLKKPVTFPFLDASTLALRKRWCRLELTLNRRLARTTYLGIVPLVETVQGLRLGGSGRVVEWLVKMRRLPETRMLDQLVAKGRVGQGDMLHIAQILVRFFKKTQRNAHINRFGTPTSVAQLVLGNLQECASFVGRLLSESDRHFLESSYRQFLTLHESLLQRRVLDGRIVDGHGDLRCENICLTDPVTIFDCVEFQPAFRCGDILNDFSFLVMDLEFRGKQRLADALVSAYRRGCHDPSSEALLPFYKCHRSLVRGKVRGLAWLQHPRTAAGRRLRELSRRHFALALRYARQFAPPRLIAVGGLIGTGKSTLARALAERLGAVWLRTDEIRLKEFSRFRREGTGFSQGLYASRISALVYQRLIERAEAAIHQGKSVVCDGTFSKAEGREALRRIAKRHRASFYFFECTVPRAVAMRRAGRRWIARSDLSEAKPEHYDRLKEGYEPPRGWSSWMWKRLLTDRPSEAVTDDALKALREAWA
jgi:aminoglycoside phosphotransferase family enzyme/predicted kinase